VIYSIACHAKPWTIRNGVIHERKLNLNWLLPRVSPVSHGKVSRDIKLTHFRAGGDQSRNVQTHTPHNGMKLEIYAMQSMNFVFGDIKIWSSAHCTIFQIDLLGNFGGNIYPSTSALGDAPAQTTCPRRPGILSCHSPRVYRGNKPRSPAPPSL